MTDLGASDGKQPAGQDDPYDPYLAGWRDALLPVLLAGVWLVYLGQPLGEIVDQPPGTWRTLGVVGIAVFSVAYVMVFVQMRRRRWAAASSGSVHETFRLDRLTGVLLLIMVVCFAAMVPSAGGSSMAAVVYIVATVMMLTPLGFGWAVSLLAVLGTEVAAAAVPGWAHSRGNGLAVLLASVAVFGLRLAIRRSPH